MARTVNKVILLGRLGADAKTSSQAVGVPAVTRFSVATKHVRRAADGDGYEPLTDWHDVAVWGAGGLAPLLTKGTQVYLEGRLRTSSWEDSEGARHWRTEVVAPPAAVILLGSPAASEGSGD